jgi:Domain of unknown function (DUF1905)
MSWTFTAELFRWQGDGAWFFVRLPVDVAEDLRDSLTAPPGGFGSVRVEVRIGASHWATSVFPDKATGSYILPVKKAVRTAEGVGDGDPVTIDLALEQQ